MTETLDLLIADGVIDEVLGRLKSGKEANISLVRRGEDVIAAKVYKDRATRSFKNNVEYKEGRKVRNTRTQRAMDSGAQFGRDAAEQAWKSAEADALYKLAGSGVRVPAPVMFYEGVLLMEVVRDAEGRPAPRLIDVAIERDAAVGVYADLVAQIISMLCCDVIHGDLSPYNILASADGPTIIDFPQVISAVHNSRAEFFFLRDFDNVVRFVSGFDPTLSVHRADGRAIWRAYVSRDLTPQFVPPPPPPPRPTRGPDRRSRPDDRVRSPQRFDGRPGQRSDRPPDQARPPYPQQAHRGPQSDQRRGNDPAQRSDPQRLDPRRQQRPDPRAQQAQRPDSRGQGPDPRAPRPDSRGQQQRDPRAQQRDPRDQQQRDPRPQQQPDLRAKHGPDARGQGPDSRGPQRDPRAHQQRSDPRPPPRSDPRPPRTDVGAAPRWTESRPSSAPPPSRGGRRRPKRRW